jgi:hypothetical protein
MEPDSAGHPPAIVAPLLPGRKETRGALPWALAAVVALALGLRLLALDRHSLWFDEALEYSRAAGPWRQALLGQPGDQDPPLFALFNHFWLRWGSGEAWLRLPSALLGTATVLLAGLWAGRHLGRRIGLLTALLLAVAPVQIAYAQELNQYAAFILLTLLAVVAFERLRARRRRRDWVLYTVVSVIALGTYYGLVFPLAALGLVLLHDAGCWPSARERRRLAGYVAVCAAVLAGLWLVGLGQQMTLSPVQRRWGGTTLGKELAYIGDVGWREVLVFFLLPTSGGPALWLVAALSLVAALGAMVLWRRHPAGRLAVGGLFFGALALTYLTSLLGLYPLGYRYGLFASPPFFLALAAGLAWLSERRRVAGAAAVALTVAVFLAFAPYGLWPNPWMRIPREEMRPLLAELARHRRPGDATYVYAGAAPAFRYYTRYDAAEAVRAAAGQPQGPSPGPLEGQPQGPSPGPLEGQPQGPSPGPLEGQPQGTAPTGGDVGRIVWGRPFDAASAGAEAARIGAAARAGGCVWVVLAHVHAGDEELLLSALARAGLQPAGQIASTAAWARAFKPDPGRPAGTRSPARPGTSLRPR